MIRIAFCALALVGPAGLAWAGPDEPTTHAKTSQDSHTKTSQDSNASRSDMHYPSSGLTLETLKALPPTYNSSSLGGFSYYVPPYQPYFSGGVYPYYSFAYPYNAYGYGPYNMGMGGYYPPGAGGYYRSNIGFLFW